MSKLRITCYIVKSLFCAEKLKELHWTLNATHIPVSVKEAKKRGLEENRNKSALNYTSGPLILCQLLKNTSFSDNGLSASQKYGVISFENQKWMKKKGKFKTFHFPVPMQIKFDQIFQ